MLTVSPSAWQERKLIAFWRQKNCLPRLGWTVNVLIPASDLRLWKAPGYRMCHKTCRLIYCMFVFGTQYIVLTHSLWQTPLILSPKFAQSALCCDVWWLPCLFKKSTDVWYITKNLFNRIYTSSRSPLCSSGQRTMMYCVSCEVRTEFVYVM
jgi:hypothetical protein